MKNKCVDMVQISKCKWQIRSHRGTILVNSITIGNPIDAEEYVKNYISSFLDWTYNVIPIHKDNKNV